MVYENNNGGKYAQYFLQTLQNPPMDAEFKKIYEKFAHRILWIDGSLVPGAFQMNTAWYCKVPERDPIFTEHVHADTSELIGFFSSDESDPYDLGGKIEFSIEGEPHLLTRSTMLYVLAWLEHNPMRILDVNRPIFHYTVVMQDHYEREDVYN